ncbi:hypothetical protein [Sphingomonas xinjiangensis]|uniref:Uncharacterized protein n=1 Tax=Sphingomonas xinjiangensis TaxID=643568 RepID=A0A840YRA0_9SPHN|nr:hypothetical protein [Sphingomonas xinjiangensis]MBB5712081.1 hypothetical protein [Sphingomonas xinjiangensis]
MDWLIGDILSMVDAKNPTIDALRYTVSTLKDIRQDGLPVQPQQAKKLLQGFNLVALRAEPLHSYDVDRSRAG